MSIQIVKGHDKSLEREAVNTVQATERHWKLWLLTPFVFFLGGDIVIHEKKKRKNGPTLFFHFVCPLKARVDVNNGLGDIVRVALLLVADGGLSGAFW